MPDTTTSARSLRDLAATALKALEEQQEERTHAEAARRHEELAAVVERAGRYARQILGPAAEGAQWIALDEFNAEGTIDGERFRFHGPFRRPYDLYHVVSCSTCGGDNRALVWHLGRLGLLLRDRPADEYTCDACIATAEHERAMQRQARLQAERAALDTLPPVPSAEVTLRTAVKHANRARADFEECAYTSASAAAAVSQTLTALAREIREGE